MKKLYGVKFAEHIGGVEQFGTNVVVNSTMPGFTGTYVFSSNTLTVDCRIIFQPADDFPYQVLRIDTGQVVSTFRLSDKKITFINFPNGPYGALYNGSPEDTNQLIMFGDGQTMITKAGAAAPLLQAQTGLLSLVWATDFEMKRVANFGTAQATGMALGAPLNGTFSLEPASESITLTNTGWFASTSGVITGDSTITYGGKLVLTSQTPMPLAAVGGTEQTMTVHLAPGRYSNMTQFAAAVTTALDGVFPGSTITASVSGTNLQISSDNGSTNQVEMLALLTDEQMKGTGELKSANRWLSNADGTQVVATTFTLAP